MFKLTLKELIEYLEKKPSESVAIPAFTNPHSHRANYYELAFEPITRSTAGEMLAAAKSALGSVYDGWKGGEFEMSEETEVFLSYQGECGTEITEALLDLFFKVGLEIEDKE